MDNIERRKRKRKRRNNSVRLAILAIMAALAIVVGLSVKNVIDLSLEQRDLKMKNASLKEKKAALEQEFQNINDKNYIEEQARKQLNMVKPGEIVYILDDEGEENDK